MEEPKTVFELIKKLKSENKTDTQINAAVNHFLEMKARDSHTPRHGHFELTPLCNLDCKMCYVHLNKDQLKGQEILCVETWKDLMQQAIDAGMSKASLSGGECLTYPGFDELYLFLRSKGVEINVLTNGILLNEKRIEFFKKHRPNVIQVTLYGSSNDVYEKVTGQKMFDIVFKNIMAAKKADLPITIAITPSKYILDDIENIIDVLNRNNLNYNINICLSKPRKGTDREDNHDDISIDDYVRILKYNHLSKNKELYNVPENLEDIDDSPSEILENGLKCGAGRSSFSITWQGKMYPCNRIRRIESYPLENGFIEGWRYIVNECDKFPKFKKCETCKYQQICTFCAGANEQLGSRYELSPMWCERTIKIAQSGMWKNIE